MINFEYLINIFENFLSLGNILWGFLNTRIEQLGNIPVWSLMIAAGVVSALTFKLIRAFLGD